MVQLTSAPTSSLAEPPVVAWLGDNAASDASIARYLAAGDRMRAIMDAGLKICAALAVLVIAAWALGLLPGAVRLF